MKKSIISITLALLMILSTCIVGFAATAVPEGDNNGTKDHATAVKLSDTFAGKLDASDDVDYFLLEAEEDVIASVVVNHSALSSNASIYKVTVTDTNDKTEIVVDVKGTASETVSPEFNISKGNHYVKIERGQNWFDTEYQIKLDVTRLTDVTTETENNNDASSADSISIGAVDGKSKKAVSPVVFGAISADDIDYYCFTAPKGYFYVTIKNSTKVKGNYKVKSYSIAGVDSAKSIVGEVDLLATNQSGSVELPEVGVDAGNVYFSVEGINGSVGGYTVQVTAYEDEENESEYNNTVSTADTLGLGKRIFGSTSLKDDVDYYKIVTEKETNKYELIVEPTESAKSTAVSWKVAILKADGVTSVDEFTVTNTTGSTFKLYGQDPGTYYVRVSAGNDYGTKSYVIKTVENKDVDTSKTGQSFFDQIRRLPWKEWWKSHTFTELMKNVNPETLLSLFKTFFVPIFNMIMNAAKSAN